jgi:N-dimethylarginine dimethylaminohydrolase
MTTAEKGGGWLTGWRGDWLADCRRPYHIDTTLVPISHDIVLCSERKMIDPVTAAALRARGKTLVVVPAADDGSFWHMNLLCLGGQRLVVDSANRKFIQQLQSLGFKAIPVRSSRSVVCVVGFCVVVWLAG